MKKKLLAAALAVTLIFGSASALPRGFMSIGSTISTSAEITSGNYIYQVVGDGNAELLKYIGDEENVVVPATIDGYPVKRIFSCMFRDNNNIKSVTVSEGIEQIDGNFIYKCKNLTSLTLPASVKSIGHCIEQGTTSLTTIKVSASNEYFTVSNNVLYSKDKTILYLLPAGTESFTVPSTVKIIWPYAMHGQPLKSIKLNEGLESISQYAFYGCSDLTSAELPSTLKSLGSGTFGNCENLKSVSLPDGLESIDDYCFEDDVNLTSVKLPDSLKSLGERAFSGCVKLTGIDMPASVGTIGEYAVGFASTPYSYPDPIPNFKYRCYYATEGQNYASTHDLPYELIDPERIDEDKRKFENGEVVGFNRINKNHFWNSAHKGFYYAGNQNDDSVLMFQSFETGSTETVRDFKASFCDIDLAKCVRDDLSLSADINISFYDSYHKLFSTCIQGNKLYLGYRYDAYFYKDGKQESYYTYVMYEYDMDANKLLNTRFLGTLVKNYMGTEYDAIAVDSKGRIYVAYSIHTDDDDNKTNAEDETKHYIDMYSPAMKKITTADVPTKVYSFGEFDDATGISALKVYYNWFYWGYSHPMDAVILAKAGNNSLEIGNTLICTIGQIGYSTIDDPMRKIGDYICIDSPLSITNNLFNPSESGMSVYNLSQLYNSDENCLKMTLSRQYYSAPDSKYLSYDGSKFARVCAVPGGKSSHIIAVEGDCKIAEYDPEKGSEKGELGSFTVDHPVYELFSDNDYLYVVMRDSDDESKFYLQRIKWAESTTLNISETKLSVKVGNRKQLTTYTDGVFDQKVTWTSSDSKIASVNETGAVTAMKAGKAVISAVTDSGMKATCNVTVTDSAISSKEGSVVTASGEKSNNALSTSYHSTYGSIVNSYIGEGSGKEVIRVEYTGSKLIAETYSADCKTLKSTNDIKMELPIFGGVFLGKDNYYVVFGQQNPDESDSVEVMRIVKYSKAWKRLGSVSVNGANTYIPFDAGSLRMTEIGGLLYIHTCHEMYDDGDGLHHQANMTYVINEADMTLNQGYHDVMNLAQAGYVSHSFNQFIRTDGNYIYRLDHGDANPRGLPISLCAVGGDITKVGYIIPFKISGSYGNNYTGVEVGGFELSTNNMLIAGTTKDQDNISSSKQDNVFLCVTKKNYYNVHDAVNTIMLTNYGENSGVFVGTPRLVKFNEDSFLVMWEETKGSNTVTKIVSIDGRGDLTSKIVSTSYRLSDCQPLLFSDGLVRWYTTLNSKPVFYAINPYDPTLLEPVPGDVNRDGKVNLKDLVLLQRYLNKWDVDIDLSVADLNNDRKVNMKDLVLLRRKLTGWQV